MDLSQLEHAVRKDAALRRRQRLQPVGGRGDKIFPPTYPSEGRNAPSQREGRNAPPQHVFERRRLGENEVWYVLVDSVQSQANRLEEALLTAVREDSVRIPHIAVDFRDHSLSGLTEITSLDAPHRVYDAILRDSLLDGKPFMESDIGRLLKNGDRSTLLEVSPTALLFGCWHSTGEGGGIGAKFSRCVVSEIVAVNTPIDQIVDRRTGEVETRTSGRRTSSRIDPLGILKKIEVYKSENGWDVSQSAAGENAQKVRPSNINHGNILPSIKPLGVTCDHLEHMVVLSFAALRRLHFGSPAKDLGGRTLVAALGILAIAEQDAKGYALRSRCDLVCEGRAPVEIVHSDGSALPVDINQSSARILYTQAFEAAADAGFAFPAEPVRLQPQAKLVEIIRKSQDLALADAGGEAEDEL